MEKRETGQEAGVTPRRNGGSPGAGGPWNRRVAGGIASGQAAVRISWITSVLITRSMLRRVLTVPRTFATPSM